MTLARAGQYLYEYERKRYTFRERYARLFDLFGRTERIILPPEPEHFGDVSFYQAGMNWDTYALNARAAIIRIGQNTWPDTSFVTFYNEAKAREIALGGYWFFDGRASPDQQLAVIKSQMSGRSFELELYVDWEKDYGGAYEGLPRVVELMQKIEAAGIRCKAVGMYTGYYWFLEHSNATVNAAQYTYLRQRPLWLAWYAAASVVKVPAPWVSWTHWQYGTPALKWGQPTTVEIDANYSSLSKTQFEQEYLGGETVPPVGGDMEQWKIIWSKGARLRTGPGISYSAAPITDNILDFGEVVNVKAYKVNTVGMDEWAQHENGYWFATVYNGQPRAERVVILPPADGVADMPYRIVLGGGESPYQETVLTGVVRAK